MKFVLVNDKTPNWWPMENTSRKVSTSVRELLTRPAERSTKIPPSETTTLGRKKGHLK
jgi:hypothetical protein